MDLVMLALLPLLLLCGSSSSTPTHRPPSAAESSAADRLYDDFLFFRFELATPLSPDDCKQPMRLPPAKARLPSPLTYFDLGQSPYSCRHRSAGFMCHCPQNIAICLGEIRDVEACELEHRYFLRPMDPEQPRPLQTIIQLSPEMRDTEQTLTIMLYNEHAPRRLHAYTHVTAVPSLDLQSGKHLTLEGNGLKLRASIQLLSASEMKGRRDMHALLRDIQWMPLKYKNVSAISPSSSQPASCGYGWTGEGCQTAECKKIECIHGKCCGPDVCCCSIGFVGRDCSEQVSLCTDEKCMEEYQKKAEIIDARLKESYENCTDASPCGEWGCAHGDEFEPVYCWCSWNIDIKCTIEQDRIYNRLSQPQSLVSSSDSKNLHRFILPALFLCALVLLAATMYHRRTRSRIHLLPSSAEAEKAADNRQLIGDDK